ncbi:MAG: hypothetical protein ACF8AM_05990 [Rhodopirellula sp. JB055]|uniref:hypothetical protein n=1 Tax=Rhodopirellula sp. JB055 TaxID=3342846 RepID=UPI00370B962E
MTHTKSVFRQSLRFAIKQPLSPSAVSSHARRPQLPLQAVWVLAAMVCAWTTPAMACPFCSALAPTISDDLDTSSAAVLTTCESIHQDQDGFYLYRMRVVEVVKGGRELAGSVIEVASIDELSKDDLFWHIGFGEDSINWVFPKPMSREATAYLRGLTTLPDQGPDRMEYFLRHLRHADDVVAADAYNEFAEATLEDIAALSDQLDREWVIGQLRDASVPVHRRRLCWTFLAQCGTTADASLLDELLKRRQEDATFDPGMDAAIGCYLSLAGTPGLARIERDYLANPEASYLDTFAAVAAIRVHGTELSVHSRERLATALRHVLKQPALADLVISDLARWEDWSAIDRVAELFVEATEETRFVKTAAVLYLKNCPLPAAAASLEKLRAIDPETVRAAEASMRFYGGLATIPVPEPESQETSLDSQESTAPKVANTQPESSVAR